MPSSGRDLLALASIPPALVPPDHLDAIERLLLSLPVTDVIGLECPLNGEGTDLQLCVAPIDGQPARLARFLEGRPEAAWARISQLARRWTEPGLLGEAMSELWIEVDRGLTPSVFATFRKGSSLEAAQETVALLSAAEPPAVLTRVAAACCPPARLSHVGLMLGRPVQALRLHVSSVPLGEMAAFLSQAGWPGDVDRVTELAQLLLCYGDAVVLCLDVLGNELLPRIGLECFFFLKRGVDPRWEPLMSRLVSLGLAKPAKAEALLSWPGVAYPATAPWPDSLIVRSLQQPADTFGVVERRLSHVKLTWDGGVSAKAYFGFGHLWEGSGSPDAASPSLSQASPPSPRQASPPPLQARGSVAEARGAAIDFLLAARNQGGWWRDFFDRGRPAGVTERITGYASDEWVTAYVGAMLTTVPEARARVAAEEALGILLSRRVGGPGWGYHGLLPPDADSTTWVLRLAAALGVRDERLATARRFVLGLVRPGGNVATYDPTAAEPLARFLRMPGSYAGWCAPHTDVAAAAALVFGEPMLGHLRRAQRDDGSWMGHWWDDDEYATARATEALARTGTDPKSVARAGSWAEGRIEGSPFATALAVQTLRVGGKGGGVLAHARRHLLHQQRSDGSWTPSARLRVPAPDTTDPTEGVLSYVDDDSLFTTATVVSALR